MGRQLPLSVSPTHPPRTGGNFLETAVGCWINWAECLPRECASWRHVCKLSVSRLYSTAESDIRLRGFARFLSSTVLVVVENTCCLIRAMSA